MGYRPVTEFQDQIVARQARELAELVGEDALSATDRSYLSFEQAVEQRLLNQRRDEARTLDETLDRAWEALRVLPRRELTMLPLCSTPGRPCSR